VQLIGTLMAELIIDIVLSALCLLVIMPMLMLFVQICASLPRLGPAAQFDGLPSTAIVVPAHNESAVIQRTIRSIRAQLLSGARLLVVADNCTDNTAQLAAAAGAEVVDRRDATRIGKGYALDHGVRALARTNPPNVVVFVDADCELGAQAISRIAGLSLKLGRPVQAQYRMQSPPSEGSAERISQFAWRVKTFLRPLGSSRLGLPCQLMGTGMAIPWSIVNSINLATGHIAEDQKLSADLALAGKPAVFCREAEVISSFPTGKEARRKQRIRWEHGHLAMIFEYLPRLVINAISAKRPSLLAIALDVCIPPLSLLSVLVLSTESIAAVWLIATAHIGPFLISSVAVVLLGTSIGLAWWRIGRGLIAPRDLFIVPVYCASRILSLFRFFTKRQVDWVRTDRSA
jgi:cellulose synthase/poly-beta-1,6-N-acetylglucosamine synthase-like glycosyltransferase